MRERERERERERKIERRREREREGEEREDEEREIRIHTNTFEKRYRLYSDQFLSKYILKNAVILKCRCCGHLMSNGLIH